MSAPVYLLDTNIVSRMMREPAGAAMARVRALLAAETGASVCTSIVVQCELLYGLRKTPSARLRQNYEQVMRPLPVLPLDDSVAEHYARLRTELERAGTPIGASDALIAAHALALEATLVSADAEFARVPGLKTENWLSRP